MPDDTLHLLSLAIQKNAATIGWALFTFALGTVAGFQSLIARYSREYAMAIFTFPGISYLCIRGSLPAVLYVACHAAQIVSLQPWQEALLLGFGSEASYAPASSSASKWRVQTSFLPRPPAAPSIS